MHIGPSLKELQSYKPPLPSAPDFDSFWLATLNEHTQNVQYSLHQTETPLKNVGVQEVHVHGYGNDVIKGWYIRPHTSEELPCIVVYEGYGGGRGYPHEWLFWPNVGCSVLVMDTRGQGGGHRRGDTGDGAYPTGSNAPGFMTRGIESKENYYYRRVFTDAVCFLNVAKALDGIDANRVIAAGASQGGGIALAAASLSNSIRGVMSDVPFLTHYERSIQVTDQYPYQEIANFLKAKRDEYDNVFQILAYFDTLNFVTRSDVPALISVGLHDAICPPETVFAAINHYKGACDYQVWPVSGHEGGGVDQPLKQVDWLKQQGVL